MVIGIVLSVAVRRTSVGLVRAHLLQSAFFLMISIAAFAVVYTIGNVLSLVR